MDTEVRHVQITQQGTAVGVRIGPNPPVTIRCQLRQIRQEAAVGIEQFLWLVASHPGFELREVIRVVSVDQEGYLVRPERAFDLQAVNDLRACPALGRLQDDHGPARPGRVTASARGVLDLPDGPDGLFQRSGHELVHLLRIVTFGEEGLPAAAAEKLPQVLLLNTGQDSRIADLVAIEVQDRQHRPVAHRVEEPGGLP